MIRPSKQAVVDELQCWIKCLRTSKKEYVGKARNGRMLWKLDDPKTLHEIACLREAIYIVKAHYATPREKESAK